MKHLMIVLLIILIVPVLAQDPVVPQFPINPQDASITLTIEEIQARKADLVNTELELMKRLEQVRGMRSYLNLLENEAVASGAAKALEVLQDTTATKGDE